MNLAATPGANGSSTPVFYTTLATLESLRGVHGINFLGFRLTDDTPAAQSRAVAEVRAYLTRQTGSDPITGLPATRSAGQWPGQASFGRTMALLYIITILAFVSALFLISATMNTLIAEQAGEIAILKTLGGRRRQIGGITVRTAAMLGAAGAILVTLPGIAVAYLVAHSFAETLIDLPIGFGVAPGVVVASLLAGPVLAVAASLPALRRALRRPVRYRVSTSDVYVVVADITASSRAVLVIVQVLGLLVVAITLMGLVSALSMAVIERTREIGILRCVGARARQIRRVFTAEAVLLVLAGWVLGVPLGWLMYQGLRALVLHSADLSLPDDVPVAIPLGTLIGLLVLTLLVIRLPLRRASRIQPGLALRYQ